ncbi:hypothetical protein [Halobacillus andaensis]|uniref:hypothetical protein n=1 Tax=Halobacillus andaensis TaxID=1176239 RepID=UPI003D7612E1
MQKFRIVYKFGNEHVATRIADFESRNHVEAEVMDNLEKVFSFEDQSGVSRVINGNHVKEVKIGKLKGK